TARRSRRREARASHEGAADQPPDLEVAVALSSTGVVSGADSASAESFAFVESCWSPEELSSDPSVFCGFALEALAVFDAGFGAFFADFCGEPVARVPTLAARDLLAGLRTPF